MELVLIPHYSYRREHYVKDAGLILSGSDESLPKQLEVSAGTEASDGVADSLLPDHLFHGSDGSQDLSDVPFLAELTPAQREAALSDGPTLVLAGAGTGKTRTLTAAMARRMLQGTPSHRILALTFTNQAAGDKGCPGAPSPC